MYSVSMFHGWRIVAVGALGQGVSAGATFYAFGVLLKPLAAEFEISRLVTTLSFTLLMLVQGMVSPFIGSALDRRSVRGIMSLGACLLTLGLFLLCIAQSFWQVAVAFGILMAIGSQMFGPMSAATLVSQWFVARRGRALGVTSLGAMVGGVTFPPLVSFLVEAYGWRGAALGLSGGVLLLVVPFWFLISNRPEDRGLHPDGLQEPPSGESDEVVSDVRTGSLLRSRNLWIITASMGLAFAPAAVLLAHLVPYATDLGISPGSAATLMSVYAFCSAFGRVGVGAAADHMDKRLALIGAMAVLSLGWFMMLGAPSYSRFLVAAMVMGVAIGGVMPLWGALTGACFGRAVFGRAMGLMNLPMLLFNISGAPLAAYLYDRSGSYGDVLGLFLLPMAASALCVCFLRIPRGRPDLS
jgi:predicted MFS family arabinose efflux permease